MTRMLREFRLLPVVLLATICLFILKVSGLVFDGGYTLKETDAPPPSRLIVESAAKGPASVSEPTDTVRTRLSWAQEMFNFPDANGAPAATRPPDINPDNALVTGSVEKKDASEAKAGEGAAGDGKAPAKKTPAAPPDTPAGILVPLDGPRLSAGERAILERLGERRQELETRARELDIRESLLKSTEKRLEARGAELKQMENAAGGTPGKRDELLAAQLKSLVVMYENMKAKDAARIFDRLDMRVLIEVATLINPRRMADIMAQMSGETAERLTVEMANRATAGQKALSSNDLPKIQGRSSTP